MGTSNLGTPAGNLYAVIGWYTQGVAMRAPPRSVSGPAPTGRVKGETRPGDCRTRRAKRGSPKHPLTAKGPDCDSGPSQHLLRVPHRPPTVR